MAQTLADIRAQAKAGKLKPAPLMKPPGPVSYTVKLAKITASLLPGTTYKETVVTLKDAKGQVQLRSTTGTSVTFDHLAPGPGTWSAVDMGSNGVPLDSPVAGTFHTDAKTGTFQKTSGLALNA